MSNTEIAFNNKDAYSSPLCYLMAICPFLMGLIQEYQIAIATMVVLIVLTVTIIVKKEIRINYNIGTYLIIAMVLLSVLSVFFGVVKGESVYGVLRVASIGIFAFYMMNVSSEEKKLALGVIPNVAVVMTVICIIAYLTGVSATLIFEEKRMAGFFGYSNTFSLYLLIALIIYTYYNSKDNSDSKEVNGKGKKNKSPIWGKIKYFAYPIVMIVGILWSGSRTTLIMTVIVMVILAVMNKKVRVFYLVAIAAGIVGAILFVLITGSTDAIGRFFTISTSSSTFLGRLLYWKDGLRQLIQYPFGMGYEGFYFTQGANQTGVYETLYVHNDWIQMALDFGVLFFVAFFILFIYQIIKTKGVNRFIIIVVSIHMIMDFDLQFMVITWIVLMCMNWDTGKQKIIDFDKNSKRVPTTVLLAVITLLIAWLGIANLFYSIDEYQMSASIFPWSLKNQEKYLASSSTPEEYEERALYTLKLYDMDSAALDVMALCAADRNEYMDVLDYKKKSLDSQKYRTEVYDDYVMMMDNGAHYYRSSGNQELYNKCVEEILGTESILKKVEDETDSLAYKIYDKPNLELSDQSIETIKQYKTGGNNE